MGTWVRDVETTEQTHGANVIVNKALFLPETPSKRTHNRSSETRNQFCPCSWIEVSFLVGPDMWGPCEGVRLVLTRHMRVSVGPHRGRGRRGNVTKAQSCSLKSPLGHCPVTGSQESNGAEGFIEFTHRGKKRPLCWEAAGRV